MNLETLLSLPRNAKKACFIIHDVLVIFVSFWFAQSLKVSYDAEWVSTANWLAFAATALLTILLFVKMGLYRAVTRYVSTRILSTAVFGCMVSALIFLISVWVFEQRLRLALPVVYFLMLVVLVTSSRIILKSILSDRRHRKQMAPVIIYGAGQSGRQLLEAIKQVNEYNAVAFVDDNPAIQRTTIYDLPVYRPSELEDLIKRYGVEKILLAIPSASKEERKLIVERLKSFSCEVLAIPGMKDLVDGKISISSLKKVSVIDLLGRDPVAPRPELMSADISNKVVLVTGAGGSIGSELCRQIIRYRPAKLLLFELSEFSLYSIDKELREFQTASNLDIEVVPLLGSVQHRKRLFSIMEAYGVQTVYHAAAYKHVPMVEFNTIEGVRNNVYGTLFCAQAAVDAGVETFVLISTDKAVRPTNTMGASKRMAELCLQAMAAEAGQQTRFCMVRFGNVLGSSGSVVPVFEKQIEAGGPITLTHQDITRYFMTIPEAAQLVIQAGAMGKGGDVFVLDMGESVRIIDLAKQMIRLSGLEVKDAEHPDGDIEIKVTGLRPGEKLYEELLIGEEVQQTGHPRIMTANEVMLPWDALSDILTRMDTACREMNQMALRQLLLEAPTGFAPKDDICDLVWLQNRQAV
ncbi:nucleoside-diphosphate sugar epimerase/dehydratase [Neisseria zoodegmatis]|uniref:Nucleoside-diphosphate sugar epimerase n=1 Tax=Neisseria zoodegmatis TaxID=326523 RepID=A0A1X3CPR9_9NEIS|nr:nucleoside-diphosphate sugar epimerase/dehydratase [Neisseria zoodegmatis]OSI09391.1 nucleoside-diphosphate sugar epimerase [Neisseria zoodegmatis]SNU78625.1 pilin glycosylation protein [Neisseria zoodegmatis]SUA48819.1 pilin glycosylation protein [Neisseria zoodegmatis]